MLDYATYTAGDLLQRLVENPRALRALPPHLLELLVLGLNNLLQFSKLIAKLLDLGLDSLKLLGLRLLLVFKIVEGGLL